MECEAIKPAHINEGLRRLCKRGKLKAGGGAHTETKTTGKPLSKATVNRYLSQAGTVFKWAKENNVRILDDSFQVPTRGIKRAKEEQDPNRYLRREEYDRVLKLARVLDKDYRKMPALIVSAFHTGLRVGNLMEWRWRDYDRVRATVEVGKTKNGSPIVAALSSQIVIELAKLPKGKPDELIFGNRYNKPFHYRPLWNRICKAAGVGHRVFHELRHGHGTALAKEGVSLPMIMASMAHKTLAAAARYQHHNTKDKAEVIARVFG
jgi:integrase